MGMRNIEMWWSITITDGYALQRYETEECSDGVWEESMREKCNVSVWKQSVMGTRNACKWRMSVMDMGNVDVWRMTVTAECDRKARWERITLACKEYALRKYDTEECYHGVWEESMSETSNVSVWR